MMDFRDLTEGDGLKIRPEKAKGPAETAISPSRGSNKTLEGIEMNMQTNITKSGAEAIESAVSRVDRLVVELAHAIDAWQDDTGDTYVAHVHAASSGRGIKIDIGNYRRPRLPHHVDEVSFMKPKAKRGTGIDYWLVKETGSYTTDWAHGKELAAEYLSFIGEHTTVGNVTLLGCIVSDMLKRKAVADSGRLTGVELGFLQEVNGFAMAAAHLFAQRGNDEAGPDSTSLAKGGSHG